MSSILRSSFLYKWTIETCYEAPYLAASIIIGSGYYYYVSKRKLDIISIGIGGWLVQMTYTSAKWMNHRLGIIPPVDALEVRYLCLAVPESIFL